MFTVQVAANSCKWSRLWWSISFYVSTYFDAYKSSAQQIVQYLCKVSDNSVKNIGRDDARAGAHKYVIIVHILFTGN